MLESFVNNNPHPGIVVGYQDNNNYNAIYWRGPYAQLVRWQVSNGIEDNVDLANLTGGTQGTYHTIRAAIDNAGNVGNVKFLSYDGNPGFAVQTTGAGLWQHRLESWLGWCDTFRVRKYASQEPTYSFGSEEPQSTLASTSLTVSPSSFTLTSEGATTLTVTLTSGGSPLVGKTVTLSASSGSTNPSSGTTNSSGQVSVTYTAPTVSTQSSVTVTASFAGDASYQSSSGTSSGTIEPVRETIISISPSAFALYPGYSGQVQSLTATLRDSNYNPLPNKTITWSATSGSVNLSSGTTDPLGQAAAVYTAPTVTADTPEVTITASFGGDAQCNSSTGTSSGVPAVPVSENISASTGGTVIINVTEINVTVNILVVPPNALSENKTVTVVQAPPENVPDHVMVSGVFDVGPSGTTFTTPSMLTLPYNENELPVGVSEDNLAIYRRTGQNSWERVGGNVNKAAKTVSVLINHLSEYAVMAESAAAPPQEEGVATPAEGIPLAAVLAVVGVALVLIIAAAWISHRHAFGEATVELFEYGLSNMRLQEVDIFREIREKKEFTIPELVRETGVSEITAWRTVQKLIEKGLVQSTERVIPAGAGLGGRGKPSTVYKYVGR